MAIATVLGALAVAGLGPTVLLTADVGAASDDAEEVLRHAQAATARASSFRLDLSGDERTAGAGGGAPVRSTGDAAWTSERWKVTVDVGMVLVETIYDGTDVYERSAASADALREQRWTLSPSSGETAEQGLARLRQLGDSLQVSADVDGAAVTLAESIFLGGGGVEALADDAPLVYDPHAFLASLDDLRRPELHDGQLVATLRAPSDIVEAFGHRVPSGTVALSLDESALPTSVHYSTEQGSASAELHFELRGWNQPVEIALPPDEELDRTPWVDEEGLLRLQELTVVWPTSPPEGWLFSVWSPEELADEGVEGSCEMVELDWDAPSESGGSPGEAEYLSFLERPATCAHRDDPTPFASGGPGGLQHRINRDETLEVLVGDTAVQIDTTLPASDLDTILATMTKAPIAALITAAHPPPTTQTPIPA